MTRLLASLLLMGLAAVPAAARPNIIFILVDDLGYGDIGCFWQDQRGSAKKFDTPAIDRMAAEGAKLTHHYISASVCAPSRASFLQGRHQGHCDVRDSQFDKALPPGHTVASTLKAAGYRTIHIGKHGLAGGEGSVNLAGNGSQNLASHPLAEGFDRFFGYLFHADGHEHYPRNGSSDKEAYIYDDYRQVTDASADLYTTDAWTAAAKQEIIDEATDGDTQPFFMYLAYDTPHFKMQRPAVAYPALDNDGDPMTGGIQWSAATDGAGKVRYASTADGTGTIDAFTHPDIPVGWADSEKQHVGMIRRIDESIADLLRTLQDLGIDDNTLVIFSSDNGPHNEGNNPRTFESFANMEGIKRDMWEAGIRVPTVVRWPGHIDGATGDENNIREIPYAAGLWDWMPTFCELAEVPAPAWCDGVSLVPTLTGTGTQRDKGYLYFEFNIGGSTPAWSEFPNHGGDAKGQMQCLRIGDHMGIRTGISNGSESFHIYDVTTDPGQATDLAPTLPALQAEMQYLALTSRRPGAGVTRPYDGIPLPVRAPANAAPGLAWAAFTDAPASWQWVPEFRDLAPAATGVTTVPGLSDRPADDHFGLAFTGFIKAPAEGNYTFHLDSDTGADLWIHDGHVIADDFPHSGAASSANVTLAEGLHPIRLYYRHATGTRTLSLEWSGPGFSRQPVPATAFFIEAPAAPSALNDATSTPRNQSVLIDVLANDSDDGIPQPLAISAIAPPDHGTAELESGRIRYTPPTDFKGMASFGYTITDGEQSASATITVAVDLYSPPTATDDFAYVEPAGSVLIDVLANDSDDGFPAALSVVSTGTPAIGSVSIQGNAILFTAPAGFSGSTSFTYRAGDGGESIAGATVAVVASSRSEWWFPFDEGGGAAVTDATGKPATPTGLLPESWTDGRYGSALAFAGTGHLSLGGFNGILGNADRTVSAWIRTASTAQQPIIAWGPNSNGNKWTFLTQNGHLRLEVTGGYREGTTLINDNEWHHVAATFANDGSPDVLDVQLYIDGRAETTFTNQAARAINTTGAIDVRIASDVQDRTFSGSIDEARIFARALSPAEVLELAGLSPEARARSLWFLRTLGNEFPETSDWEADDDHDGFSTFAEFALGGSPYHHDPGLAPVLEGPPDGLVFSFNRRSSGIDPAAYQVEGTDDLNSPDWPLIAGASAVPHPSLPDFERVSVPVISSLSPFFVRLRVHPFE
ncbi:sulfatase-like hydrolase/transferase [Luteolibacter marinus]|uniref:sulfatase-like hydrolase/transferase n=1 Tax=Luteolibacter marinus TaxID=2776705 RepID=UPI001868F575|nr:sulfatase-like hydrolase/transferase [Luteolibacter marinus]